MPYTSLADAFDELYQPLRPKQDEADSIPNRDDILLRQAFYQGALAALQCLWDDVSQDQLIQECCENGDDVITDWELYYRASGTPNPFANFAEAAAKAARLLLEEARKRKDRR